MNRKQLTLLIVAVAIVGGLGLYLYNRQSESWEGSDQRLGQKLIKDFPLNDVAEVVIKSPTSEVHLVKTDDWTVKERNNYPANYSDLSALLTKVWELKVTQPQTVTEAQLHRFELLPPAKGANAGTLIEFKDKGGKTLTSLLLGKKHMKQGRDDSSFGGGGWPDGRYVMVGDDVKTVSLVNEAFSNIEPQPQNWLHKDFVKIEQIRSVSVVATNATNSWKVSRETASGEWKLADPKEGESVDSSKVSGLNWAFSSPSFTDVVDPARNPEELGLANPRTVTVETFEDFSYTLKIGDAPDSEDYALNLTVSADLPKERKAAEDEKPEDKERLDKEFEEKNKKLQEKLAQAKKHEKWTYLVSKWTVDPFLKDRKDLLAEKKEEADADASKTEAPPPLPIDPGADKKEPDDNDNPQ